MNSRLQFCRLPAYHLPILPLNYSISSNSSLHLLFYFFRRRVQESNLLGARATGSSLANWPVTVPATLRNSLNPEEPKRVERSKPISRTSPLSRREDLPLAQQLHFDLGGGERENRTPVALIVLASAFQAGTLPLSHLSVEEPERVERPWPISRTSPLSRREGLPLAQQLQEQATRDSNPAKAGFGDRLAPCALPMKWNQRESNPHSQTASPGPQRQLSQTPQA